MKYIDAEKLIAEIEKLLAKSKNDEEKAFAKKDAAGHLAAVTKTAVCVIIKKIITSLQQEQPEMDLEKELEQWRHEHFRGKRDGYHSGEYLERESQLDIARHFYELGLNAKTDASKIKGCVARDDSGCLNLFRSKPRQDSSIDEIYCSSDYSDFIDSIPEIRLR